MADEPTRNTVNGREVGYFNLSLTALVAGDSGPEIPVSDLKGANYQTTRAVGKSGGAGSIRRTRRTRGTRTYTNSLVFYRSGWLPFKARLAAIAKERGIVDEDGRALIGEVSFNVLLTYSWLDDEAIQTIKLEDSQIIDESEAVTEGEAPNEITVGLDTIVNSEKVGDDLWATL